MRLANGACELLLRKRERVGNFMGALLYQTLRESIVDAIRSKIFNHEIKPGQRIVELELAKEFHTSRDRSVKHSDNWKMKELLCIQET